MELHHHAHQNGKKTWKSYLSEFLMLFLAVFSGFIAENLREKYTEREKEHEYIQSMINDLQKDSLQLSSVSSINKKIIKGLDSLMISLKTPLSDSVIRKIYHYVNYAINSVLYENATSTISQLKNAGGFRLIRDTASANAIANYDLVNDAIKKQSDAYYSLTLDILNVVETVMDFSVISKSALQKAFFLEQDPVKMRLLYNKCYLQQKVIYQYTLSLDYQRAQTVKYIHLLKKQYNLKE
jgi:hypothetical protein